MSQPTPLVSVLAGSAGSAASAELQNYPELELVRLEDAAPGETIGMLARGLARASGELAVFLAPGDRLLPDAIDRLAEALVSRPTVGLVYPAFRILDANGSEIATTVPEELGFTEMLMFQFNPVGPGAMFRRDLAQEAVRLDTGSPPFGEFIFWARLAARGQVRRLIELLASRRVGAAVPAASGADSARARLAALKRILSEPGAPELPEAVMRSAARSACVLAAMEFEAGFNSPDERFYVADRFSEQGLAQAVGDDDAEVARLEANIVSLEQRLARHEAVIPVLEATIVARENRLAGVPHGAERSLRGVVRRLLRGGDGRSR